MADSDSSGSSHASLTVEQVKDALHARFDGLIDMSDVKKKDPVDLERKFLSRAIAAFALVTLADAEPEAAAAAITDDFEDCGLDAVFVDLADKAVYFVQSKWTSHGTETIKEGDCLKFLRGVSNLFTGDFSKFSERIRKREAELRANILKRADMRMVLVLAFNSANPISSHVQNIMSEYLSRQNNVGDRDVFSQETVDLKVIYRVLSTGKRISDQITLSEWGTIEHPYRGYYGMMNVQDIGRCGKALMSRNIRFHVGETGVNDALAQTIQNEPANFWYFNNGITILCDKLEKTHHNGENRNFGVFNCEGMSVVNGAQTVGVIIERAKRDPPGFAEIKARVGVRIISLQNCPDGFAAAVARATNTQNQIRSINFIAFDENQPRLSIEMEGLGKTYAYKEGDRILDQSAGCTAEEAAVSLACADKDINLAVLAKREVGRLWANTNDKPYTTLFHHGLRAAHAWRAVRILRAVTTALGQINVDAYPRGELVAIHGNRFMLHVVFRDPLVKQFRDLKRTDEELLARAESITPSVFERLTRLVTENYADNYLANLFKNAEKCEVLARKMLDAGDFPETFWEARGQESS